VSTVTVPAPAVPKGIVVIDVTFLLLMAEKFTTNISKRVGIEIAEAH
jgi:hypothetical protein